MVKVNEGQIYQSCPWWAGNVHYRQYVCFEKRSGPKTEPWGAIVFRDWEENTATKGNLVIVGEGEREWCVMKFFIEKEMINCVRSG